MPKSHLPPGISAPNGRGGSRVREIIPDRVPPRGAEASSDGRLYRDHDTASVSFPTTWNHPQSQCPRQMAHPRAPPLEAC
ncbi:protein of unknown function (plasmid) [Rhodovastum atsumiense]|nr:protein of unknown function [Rhodovastum atsumiense]